MVSPDENLENLKKICAKMHQNVLYMSFFNTHTHTVPLHPGTVVCMKEPAPPTRIQHVEPSGQA